MKSLSIALASVIVAAVANGSAVENGGKVNDAPIAPALDFRLTEEQLSAYKTLARKGDCAAALSVAHHYSFVLNDFSKAIIWLRLAAKCQAPEPKAELIYSLIPNATNNPKVLREIDKLRVQIRSSNPHLADEVDQEVFLKLGQTK